MVLTTSTNPYSHKASLSISNHALNSPSYFLVLTSAKHFHLRITKGVIVIRLQLIDDVNCRRGWNLLHLEEGRADHRDLSLNCLLEVY